MPIKSQFTQIIQESISSVRLDTYAPNEAIETQIKNYMYNIELSKSFYLPLHFFEILFRNAIDKALYSFFNNNEWMDNLPLDDEAKHQIAETRNLVCSKKHEPTHDRIISELSLGFWTALFSKRYTQCSFQSFLVKRVFPKGPKDSLQIKSIYKKVDSIRVLRNKVFHYEKIIHIKNIEQQYFILTDCIKWMNPEIFSLVSSKDTFHNIYSPNITIQEHQ